MSPAEETARRRHPYTLGQWAELGVFLDDARIPLDNNASERALRRIALGRNNYLFVGDVASGRSLAAFTCWSPRASPARRAREGVPARAGSPPWGDARQSKPRRQAAQQDRRLADHALWLVTGFSAPR
ncbi:MAG: transposase [Myxococcales bacterium]|nr:transposase [Myxococcales bacterium]